MNTMYKIEWIVVVDHDIGFFDHGIVVFGHMSCDLCILGP